MKAKELMSRLEGVISRIKYKNWSFLLGEKHNVPYLEVSFPATHSKTGLPSFQHGRRWMLSAEMSPSEVLQTALMAVLAAEEHEARESFTYHGVAVFNPHLDFHGIAVGAKELQLADEGPAAVHGAVAGYTNYEDAKKAAYVTLNDIESLDPFHDMT